MHQLFMVVTSSMLLVSSTAALAGHWVYLGSDARGNTWHIDTDFVDQKQHKVTAWKRIEFNRPYPKIRNGVLLKRAFVLNVIDCGERRTDLKAIALIDPDNSVIAVQEDNGRDIHWPTSTPIVPLEGAISLVCGDDHIRP